MVAVFYNSCSRGESPLLAHFFLTHSPASFAPSCAQHASCTLSAFFPPGKYGAVRAHVATNKYLWYLKVCKKVEKESRTTSQTQ